MVMKIQKGFTMLELMIVVAIMGILAAIAYPNYQNYVIRTKRADMMTELQNIGRQIESRKLALGRANYQGVDISGLLGTHPKSGGALYTVTVTDVDIATANTATPTRTNGLTLGRWQLTATPRAGTIMARDGALSLNYNGQKCRANTCGMGDEWRRD